MTLLDAYAVVALIADEPAAGEVEDLLRTGNCGVVVVNLAESIDISQRIHGIALDEIREALEPLFLEDALSAVVSQVGEAWLAGEVRAKHYDQRDQALSMADCFLLAHAINTDDPLATADAPLAEVARSEGVEVIALPDSGGSRP